MKINEILFDIKSRDLVLPEFQREYVWSREQAKQLMVSLRKEYPIGSLLLWKTDNPPELKHVNVLPDKIGTVRVILDGQQRLTTLYMLLKGEIPPYYTEAEIKTDVRDLYYNLGDGDFQYFQLLRMKGNPLWMRVVDCFLNSNVNVFELAERLADEQDSSFELAQKYNENLTRLREIGNANLPEQLVPSDASLDGAIDIFDRVNSQGTKLTDAELALTHVTGNWPSARRVIKKKITELNQRNFNFDLTFMIRALTCVVTKHALFPSIHNKARNELEEEWSRLSRILNYIVMILPTHGFIHSASDLNTSNVLIPLVTYLSINKGRFPNDRAVRRAMHWLYAAHVWARYTAQTDNRLEHDVTLVVREESPWESLLEQIIDQRGRIDVKPSDLEGRVGRHPLYRMVFILAKAHRAVDWFNGISLGTPVDGAYSLHSHHIFPQSVLYRNQYDPDNHLHRKIVNEVANRGYLTGETNIDISNRLPEDYLPEVESRFPGALESQFIPMEPHLWQIEQYPDFLEARRGIIAHKLNEFMDGLISEPEPVTERPITELITLGEGPNLEFKSTLQWDVVQNVPNKALRDSVLKTLAAFMNSTGGTLLIGVEDSGEIYGLENDFMMVDNSQDRFLQLISSLIADRIGPEFSMSIKLKFASVDMKSICIIDVDKTSDPVFMGGPRGREFYVRIGNTTRALDPEQTMNYIESNIF